MQIWPKNYRLWALFYYKWTRNALFTWYCHDVAWCHWSAHWPIYENFSPMSMLCSLNLNFPSEMCLKDKHWPKFAISGLYFAWKRLEMHFPRGMIFNMGMFPPGRPIWVKLWRSQPEIRTLASSFVVKLDWNANMATKLPPAGFVLL